MSAHTGRLLLYAPNVHTGGGAVLLKALLQVWPHDLNLFAWLDARSRDHFPLPSNAKVEWVEPTFGSRLRAEYTLAKEAASEDRLLCFHGIPPLLPNKAELLIFQQNRNYLGLVPLHSFSWRTRQRLRFEQTIARLFRHRCASYFVQTPSMARELQRWYGDDQVSIRVLSFSPTTEPVQRSHNAHWDFIYVADGEAHKNHRRLIEAWVILAREGIKPTLALTLSDRDATLLAWIHQQIAEHSLLISNLGHLSHDKLLPLYGQTQALVFPSIGESFGLPLIEARQVGLPIVASELDFVRDVCEPMHSFDPYSPVSIARAIRRFLGQNELPIEPVGAEVFLNTVMRELN